MVLGDVFMAEDLERFQAAREDTIPAEVLDAYMNLQSASYIFWSDNYGNELVPDETHKNILLFEGISIISMEVMMTGRVGFCSAWSEFSNTLEDS